MFVEIIKSYSGEKCAMNCKAIYEVNKRYIYVDDGSEIDWLKYNTEAYEKIKAALLKTGKFILLHNNLEKGEEFLINIDHIKEINPKEEGAEVEILWCDTTNSNYTIETYDEIIEKINACESYR